MATNAKPDTMQRVQVAVHAAGPAHTEELMGRTYTVLPAVLVKSQVLRNNLGTTFLDASDITPEWAEAANGAPVVVDHPERDGRPVSARIPEVLNAHGAGSLFRVRAENGELKGDVFIDATLAGKVNGLPEVLAKLRNGEPVELSTGFPVSVEHRTGVHNGEDFEVVIHPQGFDHLAVFADKRGACSLDDGCGLGVNHEGECKCSDEVPPVPEGVTPEAAAGNSAWKRFLGTAARILGFRQSADNQSDEDRRRLLSAALTEEFGTDEFGIFIDSVFSDEGVVVYERFGNDEAGLFQVGFEIDDDGAVTFTGEPDEVRRVTTYEPVGNAGQQGDMIMNRKALIANLVQSTEIPAAELTKLSDAQLQALAGPDTQKAENTESEGKGDGWDKAREWRQKFEELEAGTENARNSEQQERADLLDDLLYHAGNLAWSEDEIRSMELPELRKVYNTVFKRSTNYAGRGGPRTAESAGGFDFVKPIMGGSRGESILDAKSN